MNKIFLTGNLGHRASVRDVAKRDGVGTTPVVNFSLAVRLGYGAAERTQWWDCAWWGERAAKCAQWLDQGSRVLVEAEADVRQFQKRDGSAGVALVATVRELEFIGGRKEEVKAAGADEPVAGELGGKASAPPVFTPGMAPAEDVAC